jgi:hypothetical protein
VRRSGWVRRETARKCGVCARTRAHGRGGGGIERERGKEREREREREEEERKGREGWRERDGGTEGEDT